MITYEMYEEQEEILRQKAEKLKRNRNNIPYKERVGNGRYAKAYSVFREEVMNETVKYACMGIRKVCLLDDELIRIADEIVKENFKTILLLVFSCQFNELNLLLEQLQKKFWDEYYIPSLFQNIQTK